MSNWYKQGDRYGIAKCSGIKRYYVVFDNLKNCSIEKDWEATPMKAAKERARKLNEKDNSK